MGQQSSGFASPCCSKRPAQNVSQDSDQIVAPEAEGVLAEPLPGLPVCEPSLSRGSRCQDGELSSADDVLGAPVVAVRPDDGSPVDGIDVYPLSPIDQLDDSLIIPTWDPDAGRQEQDDQAAGHTSPPTSYAPPRSPGIVAPTQFGSGAPSSPATTARGHDLTGSGTPGLARQAELAEQAVDTIGNAPRTRWGTPRTVIAKPLDSPGMRAMSRMVRDCPLLWGDCVDAAVQSLVAACRGAGGGSDRKSSARGWGPITWADGVDAAVLGRLTVPS
mmetsp:Transcript_36710/g.103592  ORF Transcript_36710/g.103592 Transcript_36710/m.103592 type:complete len:274 (+) Transcript_36710:47-868(+)